MLNKVLKVIRGIIIVSVVVASAVITASLFAPAAYRMPFPEPLPTVAAAAEIDSAAEARTPRPLIIPEPEPEPEPQPQPQPEPEPEPEPQPEFFVIAMMGDTTFAIEHNWRGRASDFAVAIGYEFCFPFRYVRHIYEHADMVIVNLESAMSHHDVPNPNRMFRFNARPKYVNVLIDGGVDFVLLGNNHVMDYGIRGYEETRAWLTEHGIGYAPYGGWNIFETETGLIVGVYSENFPSSEARFVRAVPEMKDAGAELIIFAPHWGVEGSYRATAHQRRIGRAAIDAGAHIVMGTHPHVLQEMELYNGGVIYYSLGNWIFGGHSDPRDLDSVIAMVTVKRCLEGEISIYGINNVPVSISNGRPNNFQPVPYEPGSAEYLRTLSKLDGTFTGPDLVVDYSFMRPPVEEDDEDEYDYEDGQDTQDAQEIEYPVDTDTPGEGSYDYGSVGSVSEGAYNGTAVDDDGAYSGDTPFSL